MVSIWSPVIRELLNKLPIEEMRRLKYAFEEEIAQYYVFEDGTFVGVNVEPLKHLAIIEQVGRWARGRTL